MNGNEVKQRKERKETKHLILEIKDGVLFAVFKSGKIAYSDAIEIINERLEYTEGNSYPAIATTEKNLVIDKLAREYFRSDDGVKGLSAMAMVEDKKYTQILINFLLKFYKSPIPMSIFTTEEDAEKWIKSLNIN